MERVFKYYKPAHRGHYTSGHYDYDGTTYISDIANAIDAIFTAFVPLMVGACIAFVLDILVVRYERWLYGLRVKLVGR